MNQELIDKLHIHVNNTPISLKRVLVALYWMSIFINLGISLFMLTNSIDPGESFFIFSLMVFIFILVKNKGNIVFLTRSFFLGIVGYLAYGSILMGENMRFGYHMVESQTVEIVSAMLLLTNIALFFSELGFLIGSKVKLTAKKIKIVESKSFFYILSILLAIVATLIALSSGDMFFLGGIYATGESTIHIPINNLNSISNIIIFTLVLLKFKYEHIYQIRNQSITLILVVLFIYLFIYSELLRGVRMDALNGIFGIMIISMVYRYNTSRLNYKLFLWAIAAFVFIQAIGVVRGNLNTEGVDYVFDQIIAIFSLFSTKESSGILFDLGTVNDISTTFSGILMLIRDGTVDFLYGSGYLDYILRTPPEFIYPNRPQDLAWIFVDNGYTSGGGFFELSEAYLNFGIIGVMIVPFLISTLLSISYKMFYLNRYSILHSILFFSFMASFMRGVLYQSFAFYKTIVTGFILYLIYFLIRKALIFINRIGADI